VFWLKKVARHCGKMCHPTDISVRWAERLEYEITKQIITKISMIIMPNKFLLNFLLKAFYPLRPSLFARKTSVSASYCGQRDSKATKFFP